MSDQRSSNPPCISGEIRHMWDTATNTCIRCGTPVPMPTPNPLTSKPSVLEIVKQGDRWALQIVREGMEPFDVLYSPTPFEIRGAVPPSTPLPKCCSCGGIIKPEQGGQCMPCVGESEASFEAWRDQKIIEVADDVARATVETSATCSKGGAHEWRIDGMHFNEFCGKCFTSKP